MHAARATATIASRPARRGPFDEHKNPIVAAATSRPTPRNESQCQDRTSRRFRHAATGIPVSDSAAHASDTRKLHLASA